MAAVLGDGIVTLVRPGEQDLEALTAAVVASAEELNPWLPWSVDYTIDGARFFLGQVASGEEDAWLIRASSGFVGIAGLNLFSEQNRTANLGYWSVSAHAGQGYVTRASRLVAIHGFVERDLERIEIVMSVRNRASRAVAERLGAHTEGVRAKALRLHDVQHDVHVYALTRADLDRLREDAGLR